MTLFIHEALRKYWGRYHQPSYNMPLLNFIGFEKKFVVIMLPLYNSLLLIQRLGQHGTMLYGNMHGLFDEWKRTYFSNLE